MLAPFRQMLTGSPAFPDVGERMREQFRNMMTQFCMLSENGLLGNPIMAIGGTATQVQSTATSLYRVGGIVKSKAAAEAWTTAVLAAGAPTVVPVSMVQKILLMLALDGTTATAIECVPAATAAGVTMKPGWDASGIAAACFGTVQVTTDATHPFTPGTTAFNGTGITSVFNTGFDTALAPIGRVLAQVNEF